MTSELTVLRDRTKKQENYIANLEKQIGVLNELVAAHEDKEKYMTARIVDLDMRISILVEYARFATPERPRNLLAKANMRGPYLPTDNNDLRAMDEFVKLGLIKRVNEGYTSIND